MWVPLHTRSSLRGNHTSDYMWASATFWTESVLKRWFAFYKTKLMIQELHRKAICWLVAGWLAGWLVCALVSKLWHSFYYVAEKVPGAGKLGSVVKSWYNKMAMWLTWSALRLHPGSLSLQRSWFTLQFGSVCVWWGEGVSALHFYSEDTVRSPNFFSKRTGYLIMAQ